MTIAELIKELSALPKDATVCILHEDETFAIDSVEEDTDEDGTVAFLGTGGPLRIEWMGDKRQGRLTVSYHVTCEVCGRSARSFGELPRGWVEIYARTTLTGRDDGTAITPVSHACGPICGGILLSAPRLAIDLLPHDSMIADMGL
jgi:hypothetical protein